MAAGDVVQAVPRPEAHERISDAHAVRRVLIGRSNSLRAAAAALGVYAALAVFAYHDALFSGSSSVVGCSCGDPVQQIWFLHWIAFAVTHGTNPFFSTWMGYPRGFNMAINTSAPLLGLLSTPLQLTIGAVETFNVLMTTAVAASAFAMYLALGGWVKSAYAAFAGGLLYGFSPFMAGEGSSHLFLIAAFLPPIAMVLLHEIVVAQRRAAWRDGTLFGILVAAQYYISPEVLAMTAIVGAIGIVVVLLAEPRTLPRRLPHVLKAAAWSVGVASASIAYPLWMSIAGPQHVQGPPHPLAGLALYPGDLLGPILPTSHQLLAPMAEKLRGDALTGHSPGENGLYLGFPLIVVLAGLAWTFRNSRILLFFILMTVVSFILALGDHLTINGHQTGFALPYYGIEKIPFIQDILPVRFSLFLQLFAAASLAVGLDLMVSRLRARRRHARRSLPRRLAPLLVAAVTLVPLAPRLPFPATGTHTPTFFLSSAVQRIPAGSPVLTYPFPINPNLSNMLYQVQSGLRFKLIGGHAIVPGANGLSVTSPSILAPVTVELLFASAFTPSLAGAQLGVSSPPKVTSTSVTALKVFLRRYHVSSVVLIPRGIHPEKVVRYVTDALGPPKRLDGVLAWFHAQRALCRRSGRPGDHPRRATCTSGSGARHASGS